MTDMQTLLVVSALTLFLYLMSQPRTKYQPYLVSVAFLCFVAIAVQVRSIADHVAALLLLFALFATWPYILFAMLRRQKETS